MAAIEEICLPPGGGVEAMWDGIAQAASSWLEQRGGIALREAVLLVPFAALLAPARQAFAAHAQRRGGGWMPRIETPLTLAGALGPPLTPAAGACTGDARQDRLHAAEQLRCLPALVEVEQHDPARFAVLVQRLAETTAALRAAALAVPPPQRAEHWRMARAALRPSSGPAALEAALLSTALAWAEISSSAATDRLFDLRPGAWIAPQIAGPEPLAEGVMRASTVPALRLLADAPGDDPFVSLQPSPRFRRRACDDAEQEAQAAAAEVIEALNDGRAPVALVALDRLLVRRVRALLERHQVEVVDETGWRLATTASGTRVVSLLRAARAGADADTRLAWLKTWPRADGDGLRSLEARWRQSKRVPSPAAADRLEQAAERHLADLRQASPASLHQWLRRLRDALAQGGELAELRADHAGRQVLEALWLDDDGPPAAVAAAAERWCPPLGGFIGWVESALQSTEFLPQLPEPPAGAEPVGRVVITPLARAVGRAFAHVVMPGADEAHLGAPALPAGWVPPAWAEPLGLPTVAAARRRQRQALAQLLRVGAVTVLRRRSEAGAPMAPSPDIEWLWLHLVAGGESRAAPAAAPGSEDHPPTRPGATGATPPQEEPWQPRRQRAPAVLVARPAPQVSPAALPALLSATRIEALRACPYRFFALGVLGLEEAEELADPLSKRDYGNWLHELLRAFHARRAPPGEAVAAPAAPPPSRAELQERDQRWLSEAATEAATTLGLDAAELLPYQASFEVFAPAYLEWLAEREAQGWHWAGGEVAIEAALPELAPTGLRGVVDRIDHRAQSTAAGVAGVGVIDYKAGAVGRLRQSVNDPLEDTQLCVYAVLMRASGRAPAELHADYLALDTPDAPAQIPHQSIERSAPEWLAQFGLEWQRVRAGAALPALGEPPTCDTCAARGLCRRDQWRNAP